MSRTPVLLTVLAILSSASAHAQTADPLPVPEATPDQVPELAPDESAPESGLSDDLSNNLREGLDLLGEGSRRLMEGLASEMGPALDALRERLDDLDAYYPPEMLPNGDIIIRRRTPVDETENPEGGVDL